MKRSTGLVTYDSSGNEDSDDGARHPPPPKKRKLPSLSPALLPQAPVDNPALHQGRVRTTPHVEGQFAAYVYVPLIVECGSLLHKLLLDVYAFAKAEVPSMQPIGLLQKPSGEARDNTELAGPASKKVDERRHSCELHISLTRPTFLRAHQRDDFRRAVQAVAKSRPCFTASFATFAELTNDERTRTFLSLEVGAGHAEIKAMSDALAPTLRALRQKEFYEDPRFHASIAWALLEPPAVSSARDMSQETASTTPASSTEHSPKPGPQTSSFDPADPCAVPADAQGTSAHFPAISHLPQTLVADIRRQFGSTLVSQLVGMFAVDELAVQIGKDVSRWRLVGR
ncbi:hypothetical protein B0H21DRAFT_84162 [Amylocystis lapponica]|nr:hypothetical protein B0H21DRAFT_84162 [Amylocystis lapponica]